MHLEHIADGTVHLVSDLLPAAKANVSELQQCLVFRIFHRVDRVHDYYGESVSVSD